MTRMKFQRPGGLTRFLVTAITLIVAASPFATAVESCRFVQLCDTQLGMGGYEADKARFEAAVTAINKMKVDWVVICGDLVNNGKDDQAIADFKAIESKFTLPCYLAPGNHDVGNEPTVETLARYRKLHGPDYFAVEQAGFKIVILNTQLWKAPVAEETTRYNAWYETTLSEANEAGMPVLLVSHYPPFVNDVNEDEGYYNLPSPTREQVLETATKHGVRAWLAGHVHKNIERAHEGISIVASATTSKNFDGSPYGFRVWSINESGELSHEYLALDLPEALKTPTK